MKKSYILLILALLLTACGTKKKATDRHSSDVELTVDESNEKTEDTTIKDSAASESKEIKTETREEKTKISTETTEVEEGTDINVKGDGSGEITMTEEKTESGVKRTWTGVDEVNVTNTHRELNKKVDELSQRNTELTQELFTKDVRIQSLEQQLSAKSQRVIELEKRERSRTSDVETKGFNPWSLLWVLPILLIGYILYQLWKKFRQAKKAKDDLTSL